MTHIEHFINLLCDTGSDHGLYQLAVYPVGDGMWIAKINDANEPDYPILCVNGDLIMSARADSAAAAIAKLEEMCERSY